MNGEREMAKMKRKKMMSQKSLFLLAMMKMNTFIRSSKSVAIRKKKRICVKSFQQQQQLFSGTNSIIIAEPEFYLPDDCWNHVFAFLINAKDKKKSNFKSHLSSQSTS